MIRPRRQLWLSLALGLLVGTAVGSAGALFGEADTTPGEVVVRYVGDDAPLDLLLLHGGTVVAGDRDLRMVVVHAADPTALSESILPDPRVLSAEPNGVIRGAGSSWDGSTWDGSTWDGSSWDGSSWDGSTWDGSSWDGSSWDGSSWDGSSWDGSSWDGASWDGTTPPDAGYGHQWGLGAVNAPSAWDVTGGGSYVVTICVIDSGVDYAHPDLAPQMILRTDGTSGYDFVDGDADAQDPSGHGTHVAGVAAAKTANGDGISGLAQAKLLPVRVLGTDGTGTEADLALAIDYCRENDVQIILMSLGTPEDKAFLKEAANQAASAGILLVAAAGNAGCECTQWPAAYDHVLGVGAITGDGEHAGFSSTGRHVDLVAPGHWIVSTWPGAEYRFGSGTSQAAPFVAGAAALVWDANPTLHGGNVADFLTKTATDRGAPGYDTTWGHGVVNAGAAAAAAQPQDEQ